MRQRIAKVLLLVGLLLTPSAVFALACSSQATGNWSAAGTWTSCGSTVPGSGDTATINSGHTVTVDVNTTVGNSPASQTTVVSVAATGGLTVATGVTFTVRGNLAIAATGTLTMNAGSNYVADDNNTGIMYQIVTAAYSGGFAKILCNGSVGSRVTIKAKAGGHPMQITNSAATFSPYLDCSYTDFDHLGDATHNAFEFDAPVGGVTHFIKFQHASFTSSGPLATTTDIGADVDFVLDHVLFKSSVQTQQFSFNIGFYNALTTGTRQITNCVFDKLVTIAGMSQVTMTGNLFPLGLSFGDFPWTTFDGNLVQTAGDTGYSADVTNNYFVLTEASNPHGPNINGSRNQLVSGNIFEYTLSSAAGDCILIGNPGTPQTYTIKHNIALPSDGAPSSVACGKLPSMLGGANATVVVEHNTFNVGASFESGVGVCETYFGRADAINSIQNNLAFTNSGSGYIVQDNSGSSACVANYITTADYNGRNTMTGSYHVPAGTIRNAAGAHDVIGNPGFVDATRNMKTWSTSLGGAGTVADALAQLATMNDASPAAGYTIAALIAYVKAGFVPTNAAFHAANDNIAPSNGWMGALDGSGGATVLPDLVVSVLSVPAQSMAGASISVNDTTANAAGTSQAAACTTRFYLSNTSTLGSGAVALGSRAVPSLTPGQTNSGSTTVTIPAATAAGAYFVIAAADADNVVSESNETNNTTSQPITVTAVVVLPDLTVSALTVPSQAVAGASISVNDTTANAAGTSQAAASTTRFYLSNTSTLGSGAVALGSRAVPSLTPGQTNSGSTTVTIPAATAVGNYFIIAVADADGVVSESNETNNATSQPITVTAAPVTAPDLFISTLSVSGSGKRGNPLNISDTVTNKAGTSTAGSSTTNFYLSTTSTLGSGATLLGSRAVPSLAAGASSSGSTKVTIPTTIAVGNYFLIAVADANSNVAESNETNNTASIAIAIRN